MLIDKHYKHYGRLDSTHFPKHANAIFYYDTMRPDNRCQKHWTKLCAVKTPLAHLYGCNHLASQAPSKLVIVNFLVPF